MIQKFSMGVQRTITVILTILVFSAILGGCSATRLAYENGERLSYWWLDGYVDFDPRQAEGAKSDLADLFAWHRRTQLPDYVQFLESLEKRVRRPVEPANVEADVVALKLRWARITERATPALADLALSLQPAQITHIQEKLASGNDTYRKEHLRGSVEALQEKRFKRVLEQAEYWFGDFSDEQEARIRAASDARPFNPDLVYADRLRRQTALIRLLTKIANERMPRAAAIEQIGPLLDPDRQHHGSPDARAFFESMQAGNSKLMLVIVNGATDAQRATAAGRIRKWINDLTTMSRARANQS